MDSVIYIYVYKIYYIHTIHISIVYIYIYEIYICYILYLYLYNNNRDNVMNLEGVEGLSERGLEV